jgi:hypothetical protein
MQLDAGLGYLSSKEEIGTQSATWKGVSLPSQFLLGGTVGPVVIGGGFVTDYVFSPSYDAGGSSGSLTGLSLTLFEIGMFADIYINPHEGLHFQPFVGFGALSASYKGYTGNSATGLALGLGGGYDWWVGDEWSIGVMGRITYAPLSLSGSSYTTIAPALLATFTYH